MSGNISPKLEPEGASLVLVSPNPDHPLRLEKLLLPDGKNIAIAQKIIKKTALRDSCLEWTKGRDWDGYGISYFKEKHWRVHRLVYCLWIGDIPDGLFVLHKCDNPPCCNPAHLFLGTAKSNATDCKAKGTTRGPVGERNGQHKLTADQVKEIRELYERHGKDGNNLYGLAKIYGVHPVTIHDVITRRKWKSL